MVPAPDCGHVRTWQAQALFGRLEMRNLGPLTCGLARDWRLGQAGVAIFHDKRMFERIPRRLDVGSPRARLVMPDVIADQMARNAELHVAVDVLVIWHVEL